MCVNMCMFVVEYLQNAYCNRATNKDSDSDSDSDMVSKLLPITAHCSLITFICFYGCWRSSTDLQ